MYSARDVLFTFSGETLADAQQREFCRPPDQALLAICKADQVSRVLVANPWRSAAVAAIKLITHRDGREPLDGTDLVQPLRLARREPTEHIALKRSYGKYDSILGRRVHKLGLSEPAVLTFNPFVAAYCPLRWASTVTYYARDDWASFPPVSPWWPAYAQAYSEIKRLGVRVICVSAELATRVAAGGRAVVIPNGIDGERWRDHSPPPPSVFNLQRPIVGYSGTVDERLDTEIIEQMSGDDAVGSICFLGPVASEKLANRLRALPKVILCGSMSQRQLIGALMHIDVGVIPHISNPLTRAMSPLKLYEYLAAGKPVVASELPSVKGFNGRVLTACASDFAEALRAAFGLPRLDEAERLKFVRLNSWAARHERMLEVMLSDERNWWDA